jgi:chromosome segregation ATPase
MKSVSFITLLLLACLVETKAQKTIQLNEDSINFGNKNLPGVTVIIPEAGYEQTLKAWKKEMQSGTKSKLVTENSEMSIFGAKLKKISPNPVNVFSKLMNLDSMLKLSVIIEIKNDQYVERSTGETELTEVKNYLKEFAKEQYTDVAKSQLDTEEKKLKSLQKDLSSLEKDKENLQEAIQSNNTKIIEEKQNIALQNGEVSTVTSELTAQSKEVGAMEEGPVKKAKEDYLSGLEKRKKKALNSIESSENRINRANNEIGKAESQIPKNEQMQKQVTEEIDKQQAVVQKFQDKLNKIKSY